MNEIIEKPWGREEILESAPDYWLKKLYVRPGAKLSLQSHQDRSELWIVLSGRVEIIKGDAKLTLAPSESVKIERNEKHRITGLEDACVLEAAFGQTRADDITRYEDDYGRV